MVFGVRVAGKRVKQTRGAGGTQAGAAGLVGDDWWALPFHDPRAICLGRQWLRLSDTEGTEGGREEEDRAAMLENLQLISNSVHRFILAVDWQLWQTWLRSP